MPWLWVWLLVATGLFSWLGPWVALADWHFPPPPPPWFLPFPPPLGACLAFALGKGGPFPVLLALAAGLVGASFLGLRQSETECFVEPHLRHLPFVGGC